MIFTILTIAWILLLALLFTEKQREKKSWANVLMGVILGLYIYNTAGNVNIQNLATVFIMLAVIVLSIVFVPKAQNQKPVITRNVLAVVSSIVIFVHFVIFVIL